MYIQATPPAITGIARPNIVLWWMLKRSARTWEDGGGGWRGKIPNNRRRIDSDTRGGWPTNHPAENPWRRVMYHVSGRKRAAPVWVSVDGRLTILCSKGSLGDKRGKACPCWSVIARETLHTLPRLSGRQRTQWKAADAALRTGESFACSTSDFCNAVLSRFEPF